MPSVPKPRRSWPRRIARAIGYLLLGILALVVIAIGYIHTGAGQARLRGVIRDGLAENVNGKVELERFKLTLFGEIAIGGLEIFDAKGDEAIALGSVRVVPVWKSLIAGGPIIDLVEIKGVRVHVVKDAAGGSNLDKLFKEQPPPEKPPPPSKELVILRKLAIDDVTVVIDQPDGSQVRVGDVVVDASISAIPDQKTITLELAKLGASVAIDKGDGALKIGVRDFKTGLTVGLEHGVGKATLHPTTATIAVTLPGRIEKTFPFSIDSVVFDVDEEKIKGSLAGLAAGALALSSIDVSSATADDGPKRANAVGLHVDAKKVNDLLGKQLLLSDADVELQVSAQGNALTVGAGVKTSGGTIKLDGAVGGDEVTPTFDVKLDVNDVATAKLLVPNATAVPPIEIGHIGLAVKGQGRSRSTVKATARLDIEHVHARGVPLDSVVIEAHVDHGVVTIDSVSVDTLGQRATLEGGGDLNAETIDLTLGVEGDPGDAIARLKALGLPIEGALPKGAITLRKGDLTVHAKGAVKGAMTFDVNGPALHVLGARVGVTAHAVVQKKDPASDEVDVRDLHADVKLAGLKLSSVGALKGKNLPVDGTLSGHVTVDGTPADPKAKFDLAFRDTRAGILPVDVELGVNGHADGRNAHVSIVAKRSGDQGITLVSASADLPLAGDAKHRALDTSRPLSVKLDIPKRTVAELLDVTPLPDFVKRKAPKGEVALALDVHGTARRPEGTFDLDLRTRYLADKEQRVHLTGNFGSDTEAKANVDLAAWLDDAAPETMTGKIFAKASMAGGKPRDVAWTANVDLVPQKLAEMPLPPERAERLRAIGGQAEAHVALHGNASDANGEVRVIARDLKPGGGGPVGANVVLTLQDAEAAVDAVVDLAGSPLLTARGKAGVAGRGLLDKLRAKVVLDPSLDVAVDIPKRPIASLSALRPKLAAMPGVLEGHIGVSGTASLPLAKGQIAAKDFDTLDGHPGGVVIDLDANRDDLLAGVGIGALAGGNRAIHVDAHASRAAVLGLGAGQPLPIDASLRADSVDLRSVVPKLALEGKGIGVEGTLDSTLAVHAIIEKKGEAPPALTGGGVSGKLDLHDATVHLPGTARTYREVGLHLEAEGSELRIAGINAVESDAENRRRVLEIKGKVTLDALKPERADVDLHADKWLLFGTKNIGRPDAPRGTLSLDAHVGADIGSKLRRVRVDVKSLEALFPDRFDKAHQPEDVHVGDVMFVGDPGVTVGKLPVPESVLAKKEGAPPPEQHASEAQDDDDEEGLDATIAIDHARVLQSPLDISPHGAISIRVRPSGRAIRGKLEMTKGELSLGGKMHALEKGSLVFDDKHPEGFMDLTFARKVPIPAMREISEASAGDEIEIHMFGPLSDRKTVLMGAGSPGTLYDLLSMHNAGHVRYESEPGMPMSNTVQFPELENVLALSFISVNLPHLLFLDRASAWANAYDDEKSYGRVEHYEAERLVADGKVRVLATNKPPRIGASQSELELDYLFMSTPRTAVGIGVAGGSRGGGGPALFWEWSSKE